jgi:hypothetical protein
MRFDQKIIAGLIMTGVFAFYVGGVLLCSPFILFWPGRISGLTWTQSFKSRWTLIRILIKSISPRVNPIFNELRSHEREE